MKARENPFAPARTERLLAFDPGLIGSSWEGIEERWAALGRRACVVGHHGSGKTCFLDAFARRLERQLSVVRMFFDLDHRRLDEADRETLAEAAGSVLLVDGDAHLRWSDRRELWRVARGARGILCARHRPGGLPVLLRLQADVALARKLAARLVPGEIPDLPERLKRQRHNLRDLWLDCYDREKSKI